MIGIHDKGLDFHGGIFLGLALFYFNAIAAQSPKAEKETMAGASYALPKMVFITGLFVYGHYVSVALAVYLLYKWTPLELTVFLKRAYNIDTKKLKVSAAAISLTQQQPSVLATSPPLPPLPLPSPQAFGSFKPKMTLMGGATIVGFVYGFLHPIIGVQMMASSTM